MVPPSAEAVQVGVSLRMRRGTLIIWSLVCSLVFGGFLAHGRVSVSLLESRHAFPSQADPHATRWFRQYALSEMPAGHVVSQPSGHTARHLHVEQLRIHLVRIRRPTRGWSGPVGLPVVWYGRLREDVPQDTARFWGARAARGSSTRVVRLVRDVGYLFGLAMMTLYLLYLLLVAGE